MEPKSVIRIFCDICGMKIELDDTQETEIDARRWHIFKESYIKSYFEYMLSDVEKANVQLIRKAEKSRGN
ncbi:MAG: hypothetical protein V8Q42_11905 [Anaerovoracaceae bacterium]